MARCSLKFCIDNLGCICDQPATQLKSFGALKGRNKKMLRNHPGDYVKEEMEERGWTIVDLEEKSQLKGYVLRELIAHNRNVTPVVALGLSQAFGTSKDFWINLQTDYGAPEDLSHVSTSIPEKSC